jgi:DNA sulfur modification protein DndE
MMQSFLMNRQDETEFQTKITFTGAIRILVGSSFDDEKIYFNINDTSIHNNAHIAVAGNSGTGKTYFANRFLNKLFLKRKGEVNFIFLDFKGITDEDEKKNSLFLIKRKPS